MSLFSKHILYSELECPDGWAGQSGVCGSNGSEKSPSQLSGLFSSIMWQLWSEKLRSLYGGFVRKMLTMLTWPWFFQFKEKPLKAHMFWPVCMNVQL